MTGGISFGEEICKGGCGAHGGGSGFPGENVEVFTVINPAIPLFYSGRKDGGCPASDAKM
jgi:hypothetical protein